MLVLGIETATETCSVALCNEEDVVAEASLHLPRTHAERLPLLIEQALAHAELQPSDLDAVAVSKGPGSYTGLRIGVSTAKGIVEATGTALVGVPSLEAMSMGMAPWTDAGDLIVASFGSRRGEVYAAAYEVPDNETLKTIRKATALSLEEAGEWLPQTRNGRLWMGGPGAPKLAASLPEQDAHAIRVLGEAAVAPSGTWIAEIGLRRFREEKTDDAVTFEPLYLKDFVPG